MSKTQDSQEPQAKSAGKSASIAMFLKSAIPDFILTLVVAVALVSAASYGFESAPELTSNYLLIAGYSALLMVPMMFGAYSKRTLAPGIVLTALLAVVVIGLGVAQTPADVPLFADGWVNDVAENHVIFHCVLVIVVIIVFLLSRSKAGLVVLLIASILCCSFVQFLFREWSSQANGLATSVVALLGVCALFVYQGYKAGIMGAQRAKKTRFIGAALFSAVVALLCVGAGAGLYYGIVKPINPSTLQIKPFQEIYAQPTIEYMGVSGYIFIYNDENTNNQNDIQQNTNQNQEQKDNKNGAVGEAYAAITKALDNLDPENWNAAFDPVAFQKAAVTALWVILGVAVVLAALVMLRRRYRVTRLQKLAGMGYAQQIAWLYEWLLERFRRLKVPRAQSLTPLEFALGSRRVLQSFDDTDHDIDFVRVTDIYQRACFGAEPVSDDELDEVKAYYRAFFGNAYRYSGKLRWALWRFWRV